MKALLISAMVLLVFAASFAAVTADNENAGRGSQPDITHNASAGERGAASIEVEDNETEITRNESAGERVIAPIKARIKERIRTRVEKILEGGVKQIKVINAGRYHLNKTVTIVNNTYKKIEIDTPKGSITVEVAGRTPAEVTRNEVFVKRLSEEFENYTEIKKVELDAIRNKIQVRVTNENGDEVNEEIPETVRTRVRARIQRKPVNITLDSGKKQIILSSEAASAIVKDKIEVENETVYLVTAKIRKRIHVLPDNASETAKLRANFHVVKAMELVEEDGNVVYKLQGRQIGKILGLIPTEMDVESDVDAETGDVKNIRRPWWSFLVF